MYWNHKLALKLVRIVKDYLIIIICFKHISNDPLQKFEFHCCARIIRHNVHFSYERLYIQLHNTKMRKQKVKKKNKFYMYHACKKCWNINPWENLHFWNKNVHCQMHINAQWFKSLCKRVFTIIEVDNDHDVLPKKKHSKNFIFMRLFVQCAMRCILFRLHNILIGPYFF